MESLGNDVVWLADPANVGRSNDARLLGRILTPTERLLVAVSPDPDFLLWSLWAAKEAAFKAWSRRRQGAFSPVSFVVEFSPIEGKARVVKGRWSVPVRWTRGPDWVHALAAGDPGSVVVGVERCESDPSSGARTLALRLLADAGGPPEALVCDRPPVFRRGSEGWELPLSLSHDGPYVAAAFRWTRARQP